MCNHIVNRVMYAHWPTQKYIASFFFQTATQSNSYPVSNQFMIGDYVLPGNIVLPTQNNLGNITVKTPPL